MQGRVELGRFTLHLDLAAEPGEVVALVGPNGSGKTTTLQTVAGLLPISDGFVRIGATVVDDPRDHQWVPPYRRHVGFMFQDLRLFSKMSVVDNVAYGLRRRGADRRTARDQGAAWLERVGIADLASVRPDTLSGGQAQRVALARALAIEPDVLLLDEPMSALDADSRMAIRGELRRHLDAFTGVTLVIAHDLIDVVGLAHRVIVLDGGRIAQDTTPSELRAHPRTRHAAALVGMNLLHGTRTGTTLTLADGISISGLADGADGPVDIVCPPRAVTVAPSTGTLPADAWTTTITGLESIGDHARAQLGPPVPIASRVPLDALDDGLVLDAAVTVQLDPTQLRIYPTAPASAPAPHALSPTPTKGHTP